MAGQSFWRHVWILVILFLGNNVRVTHNQYYYVHSVGTRPVYIIDDTSRFSPIRNEESSWDSVEKDSFSARSLEDIDSSERVEVHYVDRTDTLPPVNRNSQEPTRSIQESIVFPPDFDDSVENVSKAIDAEEDEETKKALDFTQLRGDPGGIYEHDNDDLLPEPRLFFKGWPITFEYKEAWKGGRTEQLAPAPQPEPIHPASHVDPKFYDSKFYIKYLKRRKKKNKKAKKWAKLSSLIQYKYTKYLKELEQLAPDEASIYYERKDKKSRRKKIRS